MLRWGRPLILSQRGVLRWPRVCLLFCDNGWYDCEVKIFYHDKGLSYWYKVSTAICSIHKHRIHFCTWVVQSYQPAFETHKKKDLYIVYPCHMFTNIYFLCFASSYNYKCCLLTFIKRFGTFMSYAQCFPICSSRCLVFCIEVFTIFCLKMAAAYN